MPMRYDLFPLFSSRKLKIVWQIEQVERKMKSDSGNLINRSANYVPVLSGKKDHYGLQEVTGYELHTGPSTRSEPE